MFPGGFVTMCSPAIWFKAESISLLTFTSGIFRVPLNSVIVGFYSIYLILSSWYTDETRSKLGCCSWTLTLLLLPVGDELSNKLSGLLSEPPLKFFFPILTERISSLFSATSRHSTKPFLYCFENVSRPTLYVKSTERRIVLRLSSEKQIRAARQKFDCWSL
ncbi:hypothetical protein TCON_0650 [Astathelohania contejeani]|uniref:Uncharacterized protein n=1 Tax=Astathelohania contejeani TaxID=164912 RepID=A0ABQ7I181_9MICR|nr:hypothetical protein TCON_0650 [Thelohania contejeani]